MQRSDFSFIKTAMRVTARKIIIWIPILLFAGSAVLLVSSFIWRTMHQEPSIPSPLEPREAQTQAQQLGCESVAFSIDADGKVYSGGWNVIGNLANPLDLATKIKEVVEARASRLAYAPGMDIRHEVPLGCTGDRVYLKGLGDGNDDRTLALVRALREIGIDPTWIVDKQKVARG